MQNPFFEKYHTPHETIPFNEISWSILSQPSSKAYVVVKNR